MKDQQLLQFLSPKHHHATFTLSGHDFEVDIFTPDLTGSPRNVWGDWGPMYTFEPTEGLEVSVSYHCDRLGIESAAKLWVPKLELSSPMLFERRRVNPLYLDLRDDERGIAFRGYLDRSGEPVELDVNLLRLEHQVLGALMPELGTLPSRRPPGRAESRECA